MVSFFLRFSLLFLLVASAPLFAQTQAVTSNTGDESLGTFGAAITAINTSGAGGAVSFTLTSPNSTISLTLPQYPPAATQSITLEGNTVTLQNTGSNPISLLSTADLSMAGSTTFLVNGAMAAAGTDNSGSPGVAGGTGGDGGNIAVTALTSSLGVSSSLSMESGHGGAGGAGGNGANGGNGGAGGSMGITIGTLTLNNGAYLNATAGLGGPGGTAGSGGTAGNGSAGGSASATFGSLTTGTGSNFNLTGGAGNGGNAGSAGGWAYFNAGSVTMNGNALVRGGDGGSGTSSNGDGGSVEVTIGSITLGNSAAFGADGGASGGAGALAGGSSVTVGNLTMGLGSFFTAAGNSPSVSVSQLNGLGTLSATNGTVQVYGGVYNGTLNGGGLTIPNSTTFTLNGVAALTGGTTISGDLILGNSASSTAVLNSTVTISSSGGLYGSGTIHGTLNNSGLLAPYVAIPQYDSVTITQYNQTSSGTFFIFVEQGDNYSTSLVVSGASLNGTLFISLASPSLGFRDRYQIMSGGPVTGTFSNVDNSVSGMTPYMLYGSDAVTLVMLQSGVDFTAFAKTPNQTAVADVLNAVLLTCGDEFSAKEGEIFNLSSGQTSILDQLTGVIYTSLPNVLFDNLQFEDDLMFNRLGMDEQPGLANTQASLQNGLFSADVTGPLGAAAKPGPMGTNGFWLVNADSFGSVNATTDVLGFNKTNVGFLGGYDLNLSKDLTAGLMGGWLHTDLKQSDSTADAGVDGIQFGLYGNQRLGDMDLSAVAGYVMDHFKVDRTITLGSDVNQMEGDFDGNQFLGALQWDYRLVDVDTTIKPFVGIEYAHLSENAFTESGSDSLNLSLPAQSYDSLRPYVGLGETWNLSLGKGLQLVPGVRASVSEDLMNIASQFQTALGGASGNPFTVAGITPDSTEFSVGGGAQFLIGKEFTLFADYDGRFSGSQSLSTVSGGLSLAF